MYTQNLFQAPNLSKDELYKKFIANLFHPTENPYYKNGKGWVSEQQIIIDKIVLEGIEDFKNILLELATETPNNIKFILNTFKKAIKLNPERIDNHITLIGDMLTKINFHHSSLLTKSDQVGSNQKKRELTKLQTTLVKKKAKNDKPKQIVLEELELKKEKEKEKILIEEENNEIKYKKFIDDLENPIEMSGLKGKNIVKEQNFIINKLLDEELNSFQEISLKIAAKPSDNGVFIEKMFKKAFAQKPECSDQYQNIISLMTAKTDEIINDINKEIKDLGEINCDAKKKNKKMYGDKRRVLSSLKDGVGLENQKNSTDIVNQVLEKRSTRKVVDTTINQKRSFEKLNIDKKRNINKKSNTCKKFNTEIQFKKDPEMENWFDVKSEIEKSSLSSLSSESSGDSSFISSDGESDREAKMELKKIKNNTYASFFSHNLGAQASDQSTTELNQNTNEQNQIKNYTFEGNIFK